MSEFLSQDEVDSLLKGVTGETDDDLDHQEVAPGEVRSYNLASQERIVRGRMPTMEIINERFARLFRIGLFNFIRRTPEISVGPVRVLKFGEFIRNLHVPTNLNLIQAKPLRGNGLFVFDPNLVFLVVDNMFGGDGRFHTRVEGREFTQTEQRIIQKLLGVADVTATNYLQELAAMAARSTFACPIPCSNRSRICSIAPCKANIWQSINVGCNCFPSRCNLPTSNWLPRSVKPT